MVHQKSDVLRRFLLAALLVLAAGWPDSFLRAQATELQITNLAASTNGVQLNWSAPGTNAAYTVQFQDTLQDGIWRIPDSPLPFPLASTDWQDTEPQNPTRFYRVVAVPAAVRGRILSVTNVETLPKAFLQFVFAQIQAPVTAQYDVQCYRIVYGTIDPIGARTVASGALCLPLNSGKQLPLVSYQHGTITLTNDAPSSMTLNAEFAVALAFASTGYAATEPDYLGLGLSPGLHPYQHARSEATACVDMLRAAKTFCATNGVPLTNQLFLCGYSQGGHATMALLRELETYHTNEFSVTACAPMAGAYDLSGVTATNFLSGKTQPNPYYYVYILAAYQDIYHLAPSLAAILTPPYDTTLPPLFHGNTDGDAINAAMPGNPLLVLKPEYLAAFETNPRHPLRLALQDNDVYRWRPRAPLRLYHCAADQDVIIANSEVALASFHELGATQVQLIDPVPTADHTGCSLPSLTLAKAWFDSLR